jgi:hypothetical protein
MGAVEFVLAEICASERSGYFASSGVMTRPSFQDELQRQGILLEITRPQRRSDRTQLAGDRIHHLPKERTSDGLKRAGARVDRVSRDGAAQVCHVGGIARGIHRH